MERNPAAAPAWRRAGPQLPLPELGAVAIAPGSLPSSAVALAAVPEQRHPRGYKAHQPPSPLVPLLLVLLLASLPADRRPRTPVAATLQGHFIIATRE